jgi:hypothetical protein
MRVRSTAQGRFVCWESIIHQVDWFYSTVFFFRRFALEETRFLLPRLRAFHQRFRPHLPLLITKILTPKNYNSVENLTVSKMYCQKSQLNWTLD